MATIGKRGRSLDAAGLRPAKLPRIQPPTQASTARTLSDLPNEILQQIFWLSREPALIHACQATYRALPSFRLYTRALVALAYTDYREDGNVAREVFVDLSWPGPEPLGRYLDVNEIQQLVGSSRWLTVTHLQKIHAISWAKVVRSEVLENQYVELTGEDRKKLNSSCEVALKGGAILRSSMRAVVDPALMGFSSSPGPGMIRLADDHKVVICCWSNAMEGVQRVLSVHRYVPDCLLGEHNNATSPGLLRVFLKSAGLEATLAEGFNEYTFAEVMTVYPNGTNDSGLICDGNLLADQIRRTMDATARVLNSNAGTTDAQKRSIDHLSDLLALNGMCDLPVPVSFEILRACIRHDLGAILSLLLEKHVFSVPGKTKDRPLGESVTEEELQDLRWRAAGDRNGQIYQDLSAALRAIGILGVRARNRGYPHWQDFAYAVRNGHGLYNCQFDSHVEDCDGLRCREDSSDEEEDINEADNDGLDDSGLDDSELDNGDVGSSDAHDSDVDDNELHEY
jgi:hypothetical protein